MPTPITSIHDVAAAVRGRRLNLGLSQADVARLAGVSRQWVSEFESGKPTAELRLVIRLFDALRLSLSLDERDGSRRESLPPASSPVDLDALLDDYREQ
ncbi:MAG: helix-turn-helix domain-containing protein [Solirubrobacteraceae bacterium]|jgi:y4mF family transcriptional regulator